MSADKGIIRPYSFMLILINRISDALLVFACLIGTMGLAPGPSTEAAWVGMLAVVVFALSAEHNQLYRSWRVAPLHDEMSATWRSWFTTAMVVIFALYLLESRLQLPKPVVLVWLLSTPILLSMVRITVRLGLRATRRAGRNFRTSVIVGRNETGRRIADRIVRNRWMGIRLLGYFDERSSNGERPLVDGPAPVLGDFDELVRRAKSGDIDMVYVALPMRAENRIRQIIERLGDTTVSVYFVADFKVFDLLAAQWETLCEVPVLRIIDSPLNGFSGIAKRIEDVCLASLLLLICALPMLAIAIGIKLTSPGPVLYRQVRHGLEGREFRIYKFRTMTTAASGAQYKQATRNDPRVTRFGHFLRRTSLDELPQLFNVIGGTMSLVGPRPHPLMLNEQHRYLIKRYFLRHKVRPGITGWAQVNGCRGETETLEKMQRRLEYDLEYINNWSTWLDLRILVLTAIQVWRDRSAY
jgi:putative colanic acid biosynthesis UDP-glucose lipid carrier transferase